MTATQKAVFTVIYFLCMLPLSYLSRRWLWKRVCEAGGTTVEESRAKQRELVQQGGNWRLHYQSWITRMSPDIVKYNRLYSLYQLAFFPNLLLFFFSFAGLYSHTLDKVLHVGMVLVPIIIVVTGIFGLLDRKHNEK